jgi:type II secretory pathway pseudopilin PulG
MPKALLDGCRLSVCPVQHGMPTRRSQRTRCKPRLQRRNRRIGRGMTLIELVVVFSLVALLLALAIPAVARSRAVADQIGCENNLRQIGIALANYESTVGAYPYLFSGVVTDAEGRGIAERYFSTHAFLLPHVEQQAVFNSLNFSVPSPNERIGTLQTWPHPANRTAAASVIEVFLCPADPSPAVFKEVAATNFRTNIGVTVFVGQRASLLRANGAFVPFRALRAADYADGLSQTAMFSEKPRGTSDDSRAFRSFVGFWETNLVWTSLEDLVRSCGMAVPPNAPFQNRVGYSWLVPGYRLTWYNHNSGPNGPVGDCTSTSGPGDTEVPFHGSFAARSYHLSGVSTLFGDGSVRLVPDSTDLTVWRAMGTRDGSESVDAR